MVWRIELHEHRDTIPPVRNEIIFISQYETTATTHCPVFRVNEPRCTLTPKSSLQVMFGLPQMLLGRKMYAYTVPALFHSLLNVVGRRAIPSPAPCALHITRVLKQSLPLGWLPPAQPLTAGPPLRPGNFPPLTQSKFLSNATSYVNSTDCKGEVAFQRL